MSWDTVIFGTRKNIFQTIQNMFFSFLYFEAKPLNLIINIEVTWNKHESWRNHFVIGKWSFKGQVMPSDFNQAIKKGSEYHQANGSLKQQTVKFKNYPANWKLMEQVDLSGPNTLGIDQSAMRGCTHRLWQTAWVGWEEGSMWCMMVGKWDQPKNVWFRFIPFIANQEEIEKWSHWWL